MARSITKRQSKVTQLALPDQATALYIRVSTEKQASEGFGLDAQKSALLAFCAAQGWVVSESHIYIDAGLSGKTMERPQLQRLLEIARQGGITRIVALKIDRIARNLAGLLELIESLTAVGVGLVCVKESFDTATPNGRFVMQMLGAVGELERSMISERVTAGRVEKAKTGGYNGSACPLGYTYSNDVFTVDPTHAGTVERIFTEFVAGRPMAHIASDLNADGIATKTGGSWYTSTVKYVLTNGFYCGLSQWAGCEADGSHPPIISRETYEQAHQRLASLRPGRGC